MTDKELKRLRRIELIEIIYELQKNQEVLQSQVDSLRTALSERQIKIRASGSIAEAALKINNIFECAQAAADQYLDSVMLAASEPVQTEDTAAAEDGETPDVKDAKQRAAAILRNAHKRADAVLLDAQNRSDRMIEEAKEMQRQLLESTETLAQTGNFAQQKEAAGKRERLKKNMEAALLNVPEEDRGAIIAYLRSIRGTSHTT
ncbi:MAG: hypothetical protein J6I50_05270 [Clostridia bacterium]|nr:hypothetical protein [Clostridia bacterium]